MVHPTASFTYSELLSHLEVADPQSRSRNIHVKTHFNITYSTRIATSNDPIAVGCKQRTTQRNERTSFLIDTARLNLR
jgi:hypothetical protein